MSKIAISLSVFSVAAFLAVGGSAQANIFQFSPGDANYLAALSAALAEETEEEVAIEEKINLDEDFKPEDFGLRGVGILPTNPFYFLKNARRGVTSLFTFDPVKKTELKLRFASEKILEAKELSQRKGAKEEDIKNALNSFNGELERVKTAADKVAGRADENVKTKLSEKIMDSAMKYGKSLGKFEKEISPEFFQDVKEVKDGAAETFGVAFQLIEPEKASEKLTELLDKQSGSEFKHFKNLEVLKEVEEKVPEEARGAIRSAQENALNRLQNELEKFESSKRAIFTDFIKEIGGNEVRHLEILNELEVRPLSEDLRKALFAAKEETFERTEDRLTKLTDSGQREKFLGHLLDGQFEDVRLMTELEDNMGEGVVRDLGDVKNKVKGNFQNRVADIGRDETRRQEFVNSVERFHDVKSLSLLAKMEELIPEDQKSFFAGLKSKAIEEMGKDIENARDNSQKDLVYKALASDQPKDFALVKDFSGIFKDIRESMVGRIQDKAGSIRNKERLLLYNEEFKNNEEAISSTRFNEIGDIFQERMTYFDEPEKIRTRISQVSRLVAELRSLVDTLPIDKGYAEGKFEPVIQDINRSLAISEKKLGAARAYYESGEIDRAFGEAEVVEFLARDGIKLAKDYLAGSRKVVEPKEYLEIRDGAYRVHNKYEFGRFCSMMRGFLKSQLVCSLTDGTVLDLNQTGFPFFYPITNLNCAGSDGGSCPNGYSCKVSPDVADATGKCVPEENFTCSAFFSGYVYDQKAGFCRQESASGCSNPYVYHSKDECEKANQTKPTICPALPTVQDCPAGQKRVVTSSSRECGEYFGCVPMPIIDFYCGDGVCNGGENTSSCPRDCGVTSQNWVKHLWTFSDGLTETSMIFNRTDSEYLNFISKIEAKCRIISKSQFVWLPGAGNDDAANWQNFGIPDCSGTAIKDICGDNICQSTETQISCPSDCGSSIGKCQYFTRTACVADSVCSWVEGFGCGSKAQCNDGLDNDNDGFTDYPADTNCADAFADSEGRVNIATGYCGNNICDSNETAATCSTDCRGTSTTTTATSCSDSLIALLGTDCHYMYTDSAGSRVYCDGPMSKSAKGGDTATKSGCSSSGTGTATSTSYCGDTVCQSNENQTSCPADCGSAPAVYCGNNICDSSETSASCPGDCGSTVTSECSTSLIALLGTGCHSMYTDSAGNRVYCDGSMSKSAKGGDTSTQVGCSSGGAGTATSSTTGCGSVTASADCEAKTECKWNVSAGACQAVFACSSPGSCGNSKDCAYSGFYWCSNNNQCYSSSAGCVTSYCGDNVCQSSETQASCSADCGGGGSTGSTSNCSTPANCFDSSICTGSGWYWYSSGCWSSPQGGGGGTTTTTTTTTTSTAASCSASLIALLGSDCHYMYNDSAGNRVYCDGPMAKSAKDGDTATKSGCSASGG